MSTYISSHNSVNILTELLIEHHVEQVILSPGSRNAPINLALAHHPKIKHQVVLDERSAAFYALGIAIAQQQPVALVCSSGSALLNYAPAIAEAYYQRVPLIVITADRPQEWIDQDDSQTIRQVDALSKFVKQGVTLPSQCESTTSLWYCNRLINEALNSSSVGERGPVHINVELAEPLYERGTRTNLGERIIRHASTHPQLDIHTKEEIKQQVENNKKVLIVTGFMPPSAQRVELLNELSERGVVVLSETIANNYIHHGIEQIDVTLSSMENKKSYAPDIVIAMGGAIVSRQIKQFLRTSEIEQLWYVGVRDHYPDCYQQLNRIFPMSEEAFLGELVELSSTFNHQYQQEWLKVLEQGNEAHKAYLEQCPWSDMKAFETIFTHVPSHWSLILGNSTPIRYTQLFAHEEHGAHYCNRGTSGIDGCSSTAAGIGYALKKDYLFVSGDNSFLYDSNALALIRTTPHFKGVVMCNGGGGIFKFLPGSSESEMVDELFEVRSSVDFEQLITAYGIHVEKASNERELTKLLTMLITSESHPLLILVDTSSVDSGAILKDYFKYLQQHEIK